MKQRTWKKIAAFVLAFTLVAAPLTQTAGKGGLFGGSPITASAEQQEKLLTTITATGKEQASYSVENVATVSFSYTANGYSSYTNNGTTATWGWWGYGWTATVTPAEGYTITKCVFYDDKDRTATDSEAPFAVETTEEDKTPQVNGTPILANTSKGIKKIEVYGYATPATVSKTVSWDADEMIYTGDGSFSKDGVTVEAENEDAHLNDAFYRDGKNTFKADGGKITKIEILCTYDDIGGWNKEVAGKDQPYLETMPNYWRTIYKLTWTGEADSVTIQNQVDNIQSLKVTYTHSVVELTADNVTIDDFTYDGTEKTPVLKYGETVLTKGTDYEIVETEGDTASATNAGTYTIHVSGKGNYTGENIALTWKINKADVNVTADAKSKKYGEDDPVLTYIAGALFGTDAFTGALARAEGEAVNTYAITQGTLSAGDNYNINFTGADFTINKADSTPDAVTGLTAAFGKKLSDVTLPTGWTWDAPDTSVGDVGNNTFAATFTPTDTASYNNYSANLTVAVTAISATPTAVGTLNATYGDTLADVDLPTPEDGTWAWKDAGTTSVGNAGEQTFKAVFTPSSPNYTAVEQDVTINVAKADPTPDAVTGLTVAYGKKLSDVTLPTGWTWDAPATSVGNVGNNTFAATFTPTDTANYNNYSANLTVAVTAIPANPAAVDALNATYGQTLADVTLPTVEGGTWAWKDALTTSVGNAGTHTFKAVFTPTNTNYNTVEQDVTVNVAKANMTPNPVSERNATYGQTLADVTLPTANDGTWAWEDPTTTSVGNAGTHTFKAVFTPTNTNYNTVEQDVTVNVAKADPTPEAVTDLDAIYGQTLADVTLPTADDGTWAWKDPTTTSVGNAGEQTFKAVFTPTNTNYNTVEQDVTVNVAKADPTPGAVTGLTAAYGKTLEDVALPNGWTWDAPETSVGNVGDNAFAATYTPDDTANYNTLNQDLTVTVVPVNKTALNDALTNANNYLDTIKNDADYAAPSSDLSTAISTVNEVLTNDNVTEAQVAQAITDVNNAVTTAKSDVKVIDDTKAAQAVTNKINALTAAENVSTADKTDIEAARAAYDDLTEDQKARVSTDTLEKLTDAEAALVAAEKDAADQAAANDVTSAINDLPAAEDITTADKTDIEAARKAYDELTDDQKAKVSAETKAKLEAAEEALAEAEKPVIKGDVNFDGKINTTDIVKVAAHVKGKKLLDKTAARAADVNGDSIIDVTDIIMIAAHVKGKKLL